MTTIASVAGIPWALDHDVLRGLVSDLEAGRAAASPGPARRQPSRGSGSVAVVPLIGVLSRRPSLFGALFGGETSTARFVAELRAAAEDPEIRTIVVPVDSPGGEVAGTPEAAAVVREVAARKRVVAAVDGLAASAAYWIISGASEIVASPSATVGSIGVYWVHTDVSRALDKAGVTVTLIAAGKYKTELHPAQPIDPDARAYAQAIVDANYADFVRDVARGRRVPIVTVAEGYGEGRILRADRALAAGMVDRIAPLEAVLETAVLSPAETVARALAAEREAAAELELARARAAAHR